MVKATPFLASLQGIAKKLPRAKPAQVHALVYGAFEVAALAGETRRAAALLALLYGGLPPAKRVITALSTHAIDGFCLAAELGDLTKGQPTHPNALTDGGSLAERVAAIERGARARITRNAFLGDYPLSDAWREKPRQDPWFAIDRWRRVQAGVRPEAVTARSEREALARLRELLADWPAAEKGPGMGAELVLALDLAFRHGAEADAKDWIAAHGHRVHGADLTALMLCVPAVAARMVAGAFRPLLQASDAELHTALDRIVEEGGALGGEAAKGPARPRRVPSVQKRKVSCSYSQKIFVNG